MLESPPFVLKNISVLPFPVCWYNPNILLSSKSQNTAALFTTFFNAETGNPTFTRNSSKRLRSL